METRNHAKQISLVSIGRSIGNCYVLLVAGVDDEPFSPAAPGFEVLFPAKYFHSKLSASDWTPQRDKERVDGWGRGMSRVFFMHILSGYSSSLVLCGRVHYLAGASGVGCPMGIVLYGTWSHVTKVLSYPMGCYCKSHNWVFVWDVFPYYESSIVCSGAFL